MPVAKDHVYGFIVTSVQGDRKTGSLTEYGDAHAVGFQVSLLLAVELGQGGARSGSDGPKGIGGGNPCHLEKDIAQCADIEAAAVAPTGAVPVFEGRPIGIMIFFDVFSHRKDVTG